MKRSLIAQQDQTVVLCQFRKLWIQHNHLLLLITKVQELKFLKALQFFSKLRSIVLKLMEKEVPFIKAKQFLPAMIFVTQTVNACNSLLGKQLVISTGVTYSMQMIVLLTQLTISTFIDLPKVLLHINYCSRRTIQNFAVLSRVY